MRANRDAAVALLASKRVRERFMKDLEENRFVLFSQAIAPVCARDGSGFCEVLIRFKEEELNMQSPGMFLPLLEQEGLMPLLDRWIVSRVLKGIGGLQAGGGVCESRFSVNLSADTIRDESSFTGYAMDMIRKTVQQPHLLTLEILVADALAHPRSLERLMPPLRSAGCSFALSGFAGNPREFELARSLGFAFIKIDASMLIRLEDDAKASDALAALSRQCHEYGIETICMQVESSETLEILQGIDIDYAQGFGIQRPCPLKFS